MKWIRLLLLMALVVSFAAPAIAQTGNDSEMVGSVLVFPKFFRGSVSATPEGTLPQSHFEIGATCPAGATCTPGENVRIRFHWVCAGFLTFPCQETDFDRLVTINGKIAFNPENINNVNLPTNRTVPTPGCFDGYLIAWVIDALGNPISFNGLFGEATIRRSGATAGSYNAVTIQAVPPARALIPSRPSLAFDSLSYQAVAGRLFGNVRYENFTSGPPLFPKVTDLVLLTLDVQSNRLNPQTFADINFYNADEVLTSTSTNFFCYAEQELAVINSNLTQSGMGSAFGTFDATCSDGAGTPVSCLAIVLSWETDNTFTFLKQRIWQAYNDGVAVSTTFEP